MVPPCQVASTLRNEIEMHVERAAYSSEFRWCIESGYGPSRHFAATPDVGRFRTEADMNRQARPAAPVANVEFARRNFTSARSQNRA